MAQGVRLRVWQSWVVVAVVWVAVWGRGRREGERSVTRSDLCAREGVWVWCGREGGRQGGVESWCVRVRVRLWEGWG